LGRIRSREVCIEINPFKSAEVELGMNDSVLRSRVLHSSSSDLRNRAPFSPSITGGWIRMDESDMQKTELSSSLSADLE